MVAGAAAVVVSGSRSGGEVLLEHRGARTSDDDEEGVHERVRVQPAEVREQVEALGADSGAVAPMKKPTNPQ
jgi:hypothetical protein